MKQRTKLRVKMRKVYDSKDAFFVLTPCLAFDWKNKLAGIAWGIWSFTIIFGKEKDND